MEAKNKQIATAANNNTSKKRHGIYAGDTRNGKNVPFTAAVIESLGVGFIFNPMPNRQQRRAAARATTNRLNNRKLTLGVARYRQ